MVRRKHLCLSVRGALLNWDDRDFKGIFEHQDGRPMTALEAKAELLNELGKGHEVLPFGKACDGFDFSGGGCPGHEVADEDAGA